MIKANVVEQRDYSISVWRYGVGLDEDYVQCVIKTKKLVGLWRQPPPVSGERPAWPKID